MSDVSQFENVIVKAGADGEITRLRDVGRVELGAQSYGQAFMLGKQPAAGIAIFQSPGANALDVERAVRSKMQSLAASFPADVAYEVPFDTTTFVSASIDEVYKTLGEAAVIVLAVILLFLQDWRATLVPATTVPVTIIGTFAVMAALGFSINLSTLFAVVLAIGIVVDDAIVIVEGAARNIEQGMSGPQAAIRAMAHLLGPVIGITLVLISVFLPAAFVPGLTGRMYAQFALVIAATAVISAINAATLKPTQCALWLRPHEHTRRPNVIYRAFNAVYARLERGYAGLVGRMVAHSRVAVVVALALALVGVYGLSRVPTGFLPIEDQGYLIAAAQLPDGASLERTERVMDQVRRIAAKTPGVEHVITISGVSALDNNASLANAGVAYLVLKDWSQRGKGEDLRSLVTRLNRSLAGVLDATVLVLPPPPIQGVGNAAGFTLQVELRDGSYDFNKLQAVTSALVANARTQSGLQRVSSSFRSTVPQFDIEIDRVKAEALHLTPDQVSTAISAYLGSSYVDQFNKFGRTFQIYVQADAPYRLNPQDVTALQVRNQQGDMVPLGTLVKIVPTTGPSLISLYNLYPSASVVGLPAPGFSSGDAMALMEQIAARTLPPGVGYEWAAMSYQEKAAGRQVYYVFALALLLVYLVLAGQYESWWTPLSVILAVPLALLGPAAVLTSLGVDNNLYVQIGLVLLIALSAKNSILIVEVARELRLGEGATLAAAAVEAARMRFRPILMTSLAFILGMAPLVVATGAGASARKSIGVAVTSGMLASTCLAVLFVPAFFVVIQGFEEWRLRRWRRSAGRMPSDHA